MSFLRVPCGRTIVSAFYTAFLTGPRLNFVENPETCRKKWRDIARSYSAAVPRIWGSSIRRADPRAQRASCTAPYTGDGIGYKAAAYRESKAGPRCNLVIVSGFARVLVLDNIRKAIGVASRSALLITAPRRPRRICCVTCARAGNGRGVGADRMRRHLDHQPIGAPSRSRSAVPLPQNESSFTRGLLVRSPSVFMGYLNAARKNPPRRCATAWRHPGDVGLIDMRAISTFTAAETSSSRPAARTARRPRSRTS